MSCSCGSNNENKGGCCGGSRSCGCSETKGGKIWLIVAAVLIALVAVLSIFKNDRPQQAADAPAAQQAAE